MNAVPSRRLITPIEAGRKLAVHPRSLYRLEAEGAVPESVKVGASRRWDEAKLDEWIAAGCPRREEGGTR